MQIRPPVPFRGAPWNKAALLCQQPGLDPNRHNLAINCNVHVLCLLSIHTTPSHIIDISDGCACGLRRFVELKLSDILVRIVELKVNPYLYFDFLKSCSPLHLKFLILYSEAPLNTVKFSLERKRHALTVRNKI